MSKKIDFSKSVYELVKEYPELSGILSGVGFTEITKPAMLSSVGRVMTIPKGAKMKNISMMDVVMALMTNGFEIEGEMPQLKMPWEEEKKPASAGMTDERTELLKGYLKRLGSGEDLEAVRADFVKNFKDVDASEIMKAEQDLLKEGTPLGEVQKLCDVHSALFHGVTREEKIANAEKAVQESLAAGQGADVAKMMSDAAADPGNKKEIAGILESVPGHPLQLFNQENQAVEALIAEAREAIAGKDVSDLLLARLREISVHYAKKGDLLYPHLKAKYDISGPSDVMWTVDDEIRDEISSLARAGSHDDSWYDRLSKVLDRAEEMIYKEKNILFPICAVNFTQEEWYNIYQDSKDYAEILGVSFPKWEDAERSLAEQMDTSASAKYGEGEVVMPGGHMTVPQLTALLNTIPMEISFIDADNINRFFNEGPKVFKRAHMAIDREVFSCHPPKIEPMVRNILDSFRDGSKDRVPVWMEKNGRTMLVTYMAVRDRKGSYLGAVELVQDMEF
ncbi:MAG: DUF438 domain-containing protein, partial [Eubacterium sp.]|nr:DUF438 domain-containing protein [Eubacterium sp.]